MFNKNLSGEKEMKKIIGVKICALFAVLVGGVGSVISLFIIVHTGVPTDILARFIYLYILGSSILLFISGIGLLKMKTWARKGIILYSMVQIASYFYTFISMLFIDCSLNGLWETRILYIKTFFLLIPSIFIIYYFRKPSVKSGFEKEN